MNARWRRGAERDHAGWGSRKAEDAAYRAFCRIVQRAEAIWSRLEQEHPGLLDGAELLPEPPCAESDEPNPLASHLAVQGGWIAVNERYGLEVADSLAAAVTAWHKAKSPEARATHEAAYWRIWNLLTECHSAIQGKEEDDAA